MQNSVICSEDEPLFAASNIDRQRIAQTYQGRDQLDGLAEICALWREAPWIGPAQSIGERHTHPAAAGDADPVTPPDDAVRAARGLTHHRQPGAARRGARSARNRCCTELMAEFLDAAIPETLDATCLDSIGRRVLRECDRTRAMIEADALSKRFGTVDAVINVSFVARDGEITGLLGPNRAGKSTCLRMMYGVLTPAGGCAVSTDSMCEGDIGGARALGVLPHRRWPV